MKKRLFSNSKGALRLSLTKLLFVFLLPSVLCPSVLLAETENINCGGFGANFCAPANAHAQDRGSTVTQPYVPAKPKMGTGGGHGYYVQPNTLQPAKRRPPKSQAEVKAPILADTPKKGMKTAGTR